MTVHTTRRLRRGKGGDSGTGRSGAGPSSTLRGDWQMERGVGGRFASQSSPNHTVQGTWKALYSDSQTKPHHIECI